MPRVSTRQRPPSGPPSGRDRPTRLRLLLRRARRYQRPLAWGGCAAAVLAGGALLVRSVPASHSGSSWGGHAIASWRERLGGKLGLVVDQVVVEGRTMTPEPLVQAAIGVHPGEPLLGLSLDGIRDRVESLTWVQSADVERRLPGTLVVRLVERHPFAVWQNQGKFVLIDRAGQVVAAQDPAKDAAAFKVLPLVVGAGAPEHAAGLLDQLASQPVLRAHVVAAIRIGERRWNLRLNNGADVLLPEGHEAAAMERLVAFQQADALLDRPLQVLDLRLPDRLVVRPQGAAAPAAAGSAITRCGPASARHAAPADVKRLA